MISLSNFSNRELNIYATLALDVVVVIYYFSKVWSMSGGLDANLDEMGLLISKIIGFSILYSIVVFSVINFRGEEKRDERDYRFETMANTIAYGTLFGCVLLIVGIFALNELVDPTGEGYLWYVSPTVAIHLLLLALLVSSSAKAISQLVLYRRNAV